MFIPESWASCMSCTCMYMSCMYVCYVYLTYIHEGSHEGQDELVAILGTKLDQGYK